MAKLSSINKNERRKKLAKKYAGQYAKLKAIANDESKDETERLIAERRARGLFLAHPRDLAACTRRSQDREAAARVLVVGRDHRDERRVLRVSVARHPGEPEDRKSP